MAHPLVDQLRFARKRVPARAEGHHRRGGPPTPVADELHLLEHRAPGGQEQRYWLHYGQGEIPLPDVDSASGADPLPAPALAEAW